MKLSAIKEAPRARIGLYCVGLRAYWAQFKGLRERLIEYCSFIEKKMAEKAEVFNYGMVDTPDEARKAGEWFNGQNVDLIFCHSATYVSSDCVVPVHQICKAPCVVLNLQPGLRVNYQETTTGEWLAHCGACPVPEISNAFNRAGIPFRCVNGLLGLDYTPEISVTDETTCDRPEAKAAWKKIMEYVAAAGVKRMLSHARFGFLGNTYSGMLDMY
ncbi:MAG: arabinose isomerase, partial [Eubacterium sp.]|nr:arabinose isomerase [Eubacterium sp.]